MDSAPDCVRKTESRRRLRPCESTRHWVNAARTTPPLLIGDSVENLDTSLGHDGGGAA